MVKRDPTAEMRLLLALSEHGEGRMSEISELTGYTPMQLRRLFNLLTCEGKTYQKQRNGVKYYGVTDEWKPF